MTQRFIQAPAWLFAFVDLAFLMLIVMTQVSDGVELERIELGDVALPRVQRQAADDLPGHARELWQVRVHPPSQAADGPFELIAAGSVERAPERLSLAALQERLDAVRTDGDDKPLLAPHRKSESQHLLEAVSALEERWPSRHRSVIARLASN